MDEIFYKHIANYFPTRNSADMIYEKLLCTKAVIAPIVAFIQCRTSEAVAAERVITMEENRWRRRYWVQKRNLSCKSRFHRQATQICHNCTHHRTKMTTIKPTNVGQGASLALTAVIYSTEEMTNGCWNKAYRPNWTSHLPTPSLTPLDPQL